MSRHPLWRHHHRILWSFLIVATLCAIVVSTLLIRDAMREDDLPPTELPSATATPTTAPPPATPTAQASPAPDSLAPPAGSLSDLMQYAPDRLDDGSLPLPEFATYADIEAWLAMQSTPAATITEDQLGSLALPSIIANRALDPIWQATYGFSLTDVDQILAIGQSPDYVFIMRGNFDETILKSAWVGSSYQAVAYKGVTIWSAFTTGDTIDLSNPASRPAMGSLNNFVLLDDHTLIAAAKISRVQDVIRVHKGEAKSLAENDDVADLLDLESNQQRFVSAVIATGALVESAPTDERRAGLLAQQRSAGAREQAISTPVAVSMPKVKMCLFGLMIDVPPSSSATPRATPETDFPPKLTIALLLDDGDQVDDAGKLIRHRFETDISSATGQPWSGDFRLTGDSSDENGLVVLRIAPRSGTIDWLRLLDERDFTFLTWNDDDGG
jgi:hypothetical protein